MLTVSPGDQGWPLPWKVLGGALLRLELLSEAGTVSSALWALVSVLPDSRPSFLGGRADLAVVSRPCTGQVQAAAQASPW